MAFEYPFLGDEAKIGESEITLISGRWLQGRLTVVNTNRKIDRGADLRMK